MLEIATGFDKVSDMSLCSTFALFPCDVGMPFLVTKDRKQLTTMAIQGGQSWSFLEANIQAN